MPRLDAARKPVIALEIDEELAAAQVSCRSVCRQNLLSAVWPKQRPKRSMPRPWRPLKETQPAIDKLAADLNAGKATAAKLAADMPALQSAQTAATQASAAAEAALAAAKQAFDAKEAARKEFAEVLAKADAAAKKLPQRRRTGTSDSKATSP